MTEPAGAYVKVTKRGRLAWSIVIVTEDHIGEYGPGMGGMVLGWTKWGRGRAEAKGRRELARYLKRQVAPESFTVPASLS